MKKFTLLFVLALTIQAIVYSQSCLPQGISFNTQSQIDSFQFNYPNCTEIERYVSIWNDITSLDNLYVLTSIGGNLAIFDTDSLTDLSGLQNLTSIGGNLVKSQRIASNQNSIDVRDLSDGVYILRMHTDKGFVMRKMIKQ